MASQAGGSVEPSNPPGRDNPASPLRPPEREELADYFLELIEDTLEQLDTGVQGAFLRQFLNSLAGVEVSESESLVHWQEIQKRRRELSERLGRRIGLRTAAVDYFATGLLRNPILLEYEELKRLRLNSLARDSSKRRRL